MNLRKPHSPPFFICLFILFVFIFPFFVFGERLSDEALLDKIERQGFDFFVSERDPGTGLVSDRAHNFTQGATPSAASIASSGFALTVYPVGVYRNWMDVGSARQMTRLALEFFLNKAPQEHGFFYHFLDMETGQRVRGSEVSPIDTALLLAGALFAAEYYEDPEIRDLANKIYERVDWAWMLHGGQTLALSWSPEQGFSRWRWDHYNESMILYLLAIGSPTHPIPAESWKKIKRRAGSYHGTHVIEMPPLFAHQYSHIWIDFRDKNDGLADYFKNSVNATLANRQFCMDQAPKHKTYGPDSWGLTASDGPGGYKAYGGPPGPAQHDGTVAPTACGGSMPFTPKESLACLRYFYEHFYDKLWGRYGFSDAFNLDKNWFDQDVIGIDQGTMLLMIENQRSGLVWKTMARNTYLKAALEAVGFRPGTKELDWPEPPLHHAPYVFGGIQVDGLLKDWPNGESISLELADAEKSREQIRFAWDENALYFYIKTTDSDVVARKTGRDIWQDDALEVFIDPAGDGLYWNQKEDFQIGFRPHLEDDGTETWSWFQGGEDPSRSGNVSAKGFVDKTGYLIEGAIRWSYLKLKPQAGAQIRVSPAVHDIDTRHQETKTEWFFRNEEDYQRYALGRVVLGEAGEKVRKSAA